MLSKQKALLALPHHSYTFCLSRHVIGGGADTSHALHSSTLLRLLFFPNWVGKLTTPKYTKYLFWTFKQDKKKNYMTTFDFTKFFIIKPVEKLSQNSRLHLVVTSPSSPPIYDNPWLSFFKDFDTFEEYWSVMLQDDPQLWFVCCFLMIRLGL